MIGNAGFKFKNYPLPENHMVFDGDTGQSVTLEELVSRRTEKQNQISFSLTISDSFRERNRQIIESKLEALLNEDYDEDFLAPTDVVFASVKKILLKVNDFLGYEMTVPNFIIPDGEGGIKIEWRLNSKHLRILLSEKKIYLYFEHNSEYNGITNFSAEQLIEKLRWLNQK